MAWTSVPTKIAGDVFTDTMWNSFMRDNMNTGVPVLLADTTLSGSAASITFSSINQTFTHLMVIAYLRGDTAATTATVLIRFNSDSGSNYDYQSIAGNAATASAAESFAQTAWVPFDIPANTATANVFGGAMLVLPYYSQASNNKAGTAQSARKSGTTTGTLVAQGHAGFWRSSAAITSITLAPSAGNFVSGSRATLYGMP